MKYLVFLFLGVVTFSSSQNLQDGSILFTSIQSDGDKVFTFLTMDEIVGGQQIEFTDKPLDTLNNLIGSEGILIWQAPQEGLGIGEVVEIIDSGSVSTNIGSIVSVSGNFNLSTGGDQLLAFELYNELEDTIFIVALNFGTSNSWISSGIPNTNQSYLPSGLTSVLSFDSHRDNGNFNCPTRAYVIAELRDSILDYTNWSTSQDIIGDYCSSFIIDEVVGINRYDQMSLVVYPNPATQSNLFFEDRLTGITLFDSLGQIVMNGVDGYSISIEGLSKGIYLIISDQGTVKFIIE